MKILIVFGGVSPEHDISILTAGEVAPHLREMGHDVIPIYVLENGSWVSVDPLAIINGVVPASSMQSLPRIELRSSPHQHWAVQLLAKGHTRAMPFDIAMPLLHGRNGEDGTFQGMFETLGVPYTGSSVLASSIGLDKAIQKTLFGACGIPVLPFTLASEAAWRVDATSVLSSLRDSRQLPLIIKPARLGSSIGISVARTEVELAQAVEYGFQYDTKVIVEPFHDGCLEINCAAFPELNLATSACERPLHTGDYLSFSDKYAKKSKAPAPRSAFQSRVLPADITEDLSSRISALTLAAYRAIEADGILRADFLVTDQQVYLNEVNTLPGSLALSLWSPLGIDPHTILSAYLQSALTKARSRNSKAMPRSARQFIDALASQKG